MSGVRDVLDAVSPALAAVVPAACALVACGASPTAAPSQGELTLEQARAFDDFPLFYAGERVDGLPLVTVSERDDRVRYVSFVYGDCAPAGDDGGCAPPAEIQVWSSSLRSQDSSSTGEPGAPVPERTTARGLPASLFDGGTRLELTVGPSTVVVFGDSPRRVGEIVRALRCVAGPSAPSPRLPETSLAC